MIKIVKIFFKDILLIVESLVIYFPITFFGKKIRILYWSTKYQIKNIKYIGRGAKIISKDKISIGSNFVLEDNTIISNADGYGIYIGKNVGIANGCYIRTANHNIDNIDIPWMEQGHTSKSISYQNDLFSIVIEEDVWIGAHSIILSGSQIGKGAVISAGSVVSSNIPAYSIVAGNPARVIKSRLK